MRLRVAYSHAGQLKQAHRFGQREGHATMDKMPLTIDVASLCEKAACLAKRLLDGQHSGVTHAAHEAACVAERLRIVSVGAA